MPEELVRKLPRGADQEAGALSEQTGRPCGYARKKQGALLLRGQSVLRILLTEATETGHSPSSDTRLP